MNKYSVLAILIVGLGLTALVAYKYKDQLAKLPMTQTTVDLGAELELKGILRELNFDAEYLPSTKLLDGKYVLTGLTAEDTQKLGQKPEKNAVYLEKYTDGVNELVGRCVSVKGKIDSEWYSRTEPDRAKYTDFAFGSIAFNADQITKIDYQECVGYDENSKITTDMHKIVLTGTVRRNKRVTPSGPTGDYALVLEAPYKPTPESAGLSYVPIVPINNDMWMLLESKLDQLVVMEVYEVPNGENSKYMVINRIRIEELDTH